MTVEYHVLNPDGHLLGKGIDAIGICRFLKDNILAKLDDHAQYSVATYQESAVMPGKSILAVQVSCEEFVKQVRQAGGDV